MTRPTLRSATDPLRLLPRPPRGPWIALVLALVSLLALAPSTGAAPIASPTPTSDWHTADVSLSPEAPASGDVVTVRFRVLDAAGAPVRRLQTSGSLRAPSSSRNTSPPAPILTAIGRELADAGSYQVAVAVNQTGPWWLEIEAHDALHQTRFSRFLSVDPLKRPTAAPLDLSPVFLQGDVSGSYYRLDPASGSVGRLSGETVSPAGGQWWLSDVHLSPVADPDPTYGGSWRLSVTLGDALSGTDVSDVDLGLVRAGLYLGSRDQPAIATAVTLTPDSARALVYWARQLGEGWQAWLAVIDPQSGTVLRRSAILGAIAADDLWPRLESNADGTRLLITEQIVRGTGISGYRLSTVDARTLDPLAVHRETTAPLDPLTACLMPASGPVGPLPGTPALHYSLCSPAAGGPPALLTWDAFSAEVTRQTDLSALASRATALDGVVSPDGSRFYAVNAGSHQIAEIDLASGAILRTATFIPDPRKPSLSTWERLRDWLIGEIVPKAAAGVLVQRTVTISPDGAALYVVAPVSTMARGYGDGIWRVDTQTLQASAHLLSGQPVAGLIVAQDGRLAVIMAGKSGLASQISVLQPDGALAISLTLPDPVTVPASAY